MGRVALDDHGATGGKCGGRVAAGGRESEREVRGAEDGDRADRPLDEADLRTRRRLALGQCGVEAAVEILALLDVVREKAELAGGAAAFALQAGFRQAGFLAADLGDRLGTRLDLVGDRAQECGALGAGRITVAQERFFRGFGRTVDQFHGAGGKLMDRSVSGCGCEGARAVEPFAGDKVFSFGGEGHLAILSLDPGLPFGAEGIMAELHLSDLCILYVCKTSIA
ncbi:hypothetical protein D9M68_730370 [compost metagenome]